MRLVKIVKYQRVRYGDLEEGDEYARKQGDPSDMKGSGAEGYYAPIPYGDRPCIALDTDKYPPGVTYNIEGIPDRMIVETTEEGVFLDTVDLLSGDAQLAPIGDKVEETRYI